MKNAMILVSGLGMNASSFAAFAKEFDKSAFCEELDIKPLTLPGFEIEERDKDFKASMDLHRDFLVNEVKALSGDYDRIAIWGFSYGGDLVAYSASPLSNLKGVTHLFVNDMNLSLETCTFSNMLQDGFTTRDSHKHMAKICGYLYDLFEFGTENKNKKERAAREEITKTSLDYLATTLRHQNFEHIVSIAGDMLRHLAKLQANLVSVSNAGVTVLVNSSEANCEKNLLAELVQKHLLTKRIGRGHFSLLDPKFILQDVQKFLQ